MIPVDKSQQQDQRNVDSGNGCSQYDEVGDNLGPGYGSCFVDDGNLAAVKDVIAEHQQRGRQGDGDVGTEFIAHDAALGTGSGNRGIRNEREVIAEKRSADDQGCHERQAELGLLDNSGSYRRQCDNGSYRCPDRQGDEAGGQKDTC